MIWMKLYELEIELLPLYQNGCSLVIKEMIFQTDETTHKKHRFTTVIMPDFGNHVYQYIEHNKESAEDVGYCIFKMMVEEFRKNFGKLDLDFCERCNNTFLHTSKKKKKYCSTDCRVRA